MSNIQCIYKFTSPSGKVYIGSTINLKKRLGMYKGLFCKGQRKLYNSFIKYGYENHLFEIVEECEISRLYKRERYYGEIYNVLSDLGLNLSLPKLDDVKTCISEETRKIMSINNRANPPFKGKHHSVENKAYLSKCRKGVPLSEEHKLRIKMSNTKSRSKLVIDLETGIFYDSIKEAAIAKGLLHSTLKNRVNGSSPTKTMITYA